MGKMILRKQNSNLNLFLSPSFIKAVFVIICCLISWVEVRGDDWPMWRYDAGRTASTSQALAKELHLQWVRHLPPPQPAWPKGQYKLQFDASYEPIAKGHTLFVPSMVSDRVTAYDTRTGEEKWRFYTEGPVRFAPVAYQDKLYFICDDGYLYCLQSESGTLIRKFRPGPEDRLVLGNDRLINMWPARGGPVLYDDKIYFAASIWPFMGTFLYGIDAATGEVVWENSGSGSTYLMQPHQSPAFAGVAPQGYLVATKDRLLVSGGRSVPAAYDRKTGKFLYYHLAQYGKAGGCEVMASGDFFFNRGTIHKLSDGQGVAADPADVMTNDEVIGVDKSGVIRAYKSTPKPVGVWKTPRQSTIRTIHVRAGNQIFGSSPGGKIAAFDLPGNNKPLKLSWRNQIEGEVWNMLAANDRLFVVTLQGVIYCFGSEKKDKPNEYLPETQPLPVTELGYQKQIQQVLKSSKTQEGYCLLLGLGDGRLLYELVRQTNFHIIVLESDTAKVDTFRRRLDEAGLYGRRVALLTGEITTRNLTPYFANVILIEDAEAAGFTENNHFAHRVFYSLRPYGGTAYLLTRPKNQIPFFKQIIRARLARSDLKVTPDSLQLTRRGALPDSADWTHQYGDSTNSVVSRDKRVKAPLGLLWFGGPPNDKILPRHGHGPSPQVVGGRLFIEGRNILRAVDVYTGRLLWEREFSDLGKYYDNTKHQPGANEIGSNYVSLADALYVVYGETIHKLDPGTGRTAKKITLPNGKQPRWGALLAWKDLLVATASPIRVPIQKGTSGNLLENLKHLVQKNHSGNSINQITLKDIPGITINAEYASDSRMLVVMDRNNGEVLWTRKAAFSFRHNTVVVAASKIFCIDGMSEAKLNYLRRRGVKIPDKNTLYALDASTGDIIWHTSDNVFGTWLGYSTEHDVLIQAGSQSGDRAGDEVGEGMIAYQGSNGNVLWSIDEKYKGPPILLHNRIITQTGGGSGSADAEAKVFDLFTGEYIIRKHPVTGQTIPWTWIRFKGCNTAIASEHLLTFRSASGAFVDLTRGQGTASIGGFKSGCTSNLIVANGVLNAPDYTRTCTCSYQNQASLALVHMPQVEQWTVDYYPLPSEPTPVKRIGINLGAPGNRVADNGTLWLEFPSVGGPSPDIPIRATYENPQWFHYHSSRVKSEQNWIAASGVRGLTEISIRLFLQPGKNPSKVDAFDKHIGRITTWPEKNIKGSFPQPQPYTVRLYFSEVDDIKVGQRLFNVFLQGKLVLKDFDIVKDAGGMNRCVIKEFNNITVKDDLMISLQPDANCPVKESILCGVEILPAGW